MLCLKCWTRITAHNRQTYKIGLKLPYCAHCISTYIVAKKLREMNPEQRIDFIKETRNKLQTTNITEKNMQEAQKNMIEIGLKEQEIKAILQGIKTQ